MAWVLLLGAGLIAQPAVGDGSGFVLLDPGSEVYYDFLAVAGERIDIAKDGEVTGNLHSNGGIDLKQGGIVHGDVSAVDDVDNSGQILGSITEGAAPVDLPELLDEASLRALADRVFEGNTTFTDEVIHDVVFVAGTARIEGSLSGTGTLIATRDIRLEDHPGPVDPDTRLSLIALDDIRLGTRALRGVLRAGRDIDLEGGAELDGVAVADRRIVCKDGVAATFVDPDQVSPVITLVSPKDGGLVATAMPDIVVEYSDDLAGLRLDSLVFLLDGVDLSEDVIADESGFIFSPPTPLAEGLHEIEVAISDRSDNEGREVFSFVVDSLAPSLEIVSPVDPFIADPAPEIVVSYGDSTSGVDPATLTVSVDGGDVTSTCSVGPASATCSSPSLTEGTHQIAASISDLAGNTALDSATVTVDLTPPVITAQISPPANADGWNDSPVTVTFDCQDGLSGVASCPPPVTSSSEGASQVVSGTATDVAGNMASATVTVSIDLTPPTFDPAELRPLRCPELTLELRPQVRACFADGLSGIDTDAVTLSVDGVDRTAESVVSGNCVSWDPTVDFEPGEHEAVASAGDLAGNADSTSWCFDVASPVLDITIDTPPAGLVTTAASVDVSGSVDLLAHTVEVNGQPASVSGGSFTAQGIPLQEGKTVITAVARNAAGGIGTATVPVVRDTTPPVVVIETPRAGAVLASLQVDVAGLVNDVISGTTINADDCQVFVNGVEAEVSNRTFVVTDLLLKRGINTLTAEARDRVGNVASSSIQVNVQDQAGQTIRLLTGQRQQGGIFEELAQPLVVVLENADGDPVAGRPVTFRVSRGDGSLSAFPEEGSAITVQSDDFGRASARFRVGGRSGAGNNRVLATAPGFVGEVEFCASAAPGTAVRVTGVSGDRQTGVVERPLPLPLVVLVTDTAGNPVAGAEVTFEVVEGGGFLDGDAPAPARAVVVTDLDGLAETAWTLGPEEAINGNLVLATLAGSPEPGTTFTASGRRAGREASTRVSGVVLDNQDNPVPGVTVHIHDTDLVAFTDDQGQFSISGAPVGAILLEVDGATTSRPGNWAHLEFELTTVAGRDNTIGGPIYLLPLDAGVLAGGDEDVTLSLANVPGSELTVFANSLTCPDGSSTCEISVTQVRSERVPMAPPLGSSFMLAWTIQPPGAKFDPPARLCIPNSDMPAGSQVEMFSFDHDQGEFVAVGTATVEADGSRICSDPGFGVLEGGWHGCVPPPPPKDCVADCGPCKRCNRDTGMCENLADGTSCDDMMDCTFDDQCMSGSCQGTDVEITDVTGDCVVAIGESAMCTATANRPDLVQWMAPGGMPDSGMGATFSTSYSAEGDQVVTAKCDASSKTKDVTIGVDCSTITSVLMEPEISISPGPGAFGAVRPGTRRTAKYKGCADSKQWCFRLEEYLEEHGFGIHSLGRIDITGPMDSDVTPMSCAAIIADLTPPGAGATSGPPRRTYWSNAITTAHERAHVANVKSFITDNVFRDLQTFVANPSRCTMCKSATPTSTFDAERDRLFRTNFSAMCAGAASGCAAEESRAHGVSNPMYLTLISGIRARARSAPPAEGWPAACM